MHIFITFFCQKAAHHFFRKLLKMFFKCLVNIWNFSPNFSCGEIPTWFEFSIKFIIFYKAVLDFLYIFFYQWPASIWSNFSFIILKFSSWSSFLFLIRLYPNRGITSEHNFWTSSISLNGSSDFHLNAVLLEFREVE